jgi:proteasome lid subunit RPN8/RPN11
MSTATVAPSTSDIGTLRQAYEQLTQELLDHPDPDAASFRKLQDDLIKAGDRLRDAMGYKAWMAWIRARIAAADGHQRGGSGSRSAGAERWSSRAATVAPTVLAPAAQRWWELDADPTPRSPVTIDLAGVKPSASSPTLRLTNDARREMARAASGDSREVGGGLFAMMESRFTRRDLHVIRATVDCYGQERDRMLLDVASLLEREQAYTETSDATILEVGCWHSHPSGHVEPSDSDMKAWATSLTDVRKEYFGVIVAQSLSRYLVDTLTWAEPVIRCWRVSYKHSDLVVCEPVRLAWTGR